MVTNCPMKLWEYSIRESEKCQAPGFDGADCQKTMSLRTSAAALVWQSVAPTSLDDIASGGKVLVSARTLRRSRLKGRCRKAAPLRIPRPHRRKCIGTLRIVIRDSDRRFLCDFLETDIPGSFRNRGHRDSSYTISSGWKTSSNCSAVRKPSATQASFRVMFSAKAFFAVFAAFS